MRRARLDRLEWTLKRADQYARETAKVILNHRGERATIVRKWRYDVLGLFAPIIAVEAENDTLFYVRTSQYIGRCLYSEGFFERRQMANVATLIRNIHGGSSPLTGRRFIDIGANIGTATVTAIKVFGAENAIAFEPDPSNFKLLQCNVVMNDLGPRVRTLQAALSDHSGTAMLELCEDNCGDHRVRTATRAEEDLFQESKRTTVKVDLVRLDDMMAKLSVDIRDVGLVWIDTQGHEGHVLAGAEILLGSEVPVVLEYWPYALRRAGGLELLHSIVAQNYSTIVDLSASESTSFRRAEDVHHLEAQYKDTHYTDLLLLK